MRELGAGLTHAELVEWRAFYGLEPWGCEPADVRTGIFAATLANCHRGENAAPFAVADFMPRWVLPPAPDPIPEPELTDDELAAWADAAIFGLPPE